MAVTLDGSHSSVFTGLDTYTYTIPSTGLYKVSAQAVNIPSSGLTITINNNGSPIAVKASSVAMNVMTDTVQLVLAAADVITIVITGTSANYVLKDMKITATIDLVGSGT